MDQRANNQLLMERRRRMGIPDGAGASQISEGGDPRIRQRFGGILAGELKGKIDDFDQSQSTLFSAPARLNLNSEFGEGGRVSAAISQREQRLPQNDRRRRGPSQQQSKVSDKTYSVPLADFGPPKLGGEMSEINDLFGERPSRGGYSQTGPLMPERGEGIRDIGDGYMSSAPYNPASQILNRVAARNSRGADFRDLESRGVEEAETPESRYLGNASYRAPQDQGVMQEMARTISEQSQMLRALMNEQKGKKFFKEVKTTHTFNDPRTKLIEVDGQYFQMTPVNVKKSRAAKH